jgi:hypothetical protein
MDLIRSWYHRMRENGMGDWGDGPSEAQIGHEGVIAEFDGKPVACVFLFIPPSRSYAAILSAVCDTDLTRHLCFRGLIKAAEGGRDTCLQAGVREIVSFVNTPAVVSAFKAARFTDGGPAIHHVYLCSETLLWLEP